MIGYKRVNFFELCRLCTTYEGCKTPIFDGDGKTTEIAEKIRGCLQIEVKLTDSLPKYICLECLRKLDKSYEFTTSCRSSDATLQRHAEMLISDGESPGHELMVYVKDNKLSDAGTAKKPFIPKCVPIEESTVSVPSVVAPFSLELSEVVESEVVLDNAGEIYVEGNSDSFISKGVLLKNVAQILAEKSVGSSEEAEVEAEFEPEPDVDEGIIPMTEQEREWELKRHDEGFLTYCPSREGKDSDEPRVMHECEVCSKQFKRKEHLTQHRRLHTGERPFKCDYCDKSFNRKEHLVRHARSHTGEKCYSCDVCSRGFSRKDNLRKHQATHEPIAGECVSKRNRDFLKLVDVSDDGEGRTLLSSSTKRVKQEVLEDNMQAESSILILNDSGNELIQLDGKQSILLKALTQES